MNALSKMPEPVAPNSLKGALIERVRTGGPIEEQRELYQFLREIATDESKLAFDADLPAMQAELPEIPKRGRIDIGRGKPQPYALWEDVNELIKPVLSKHGFALGFRITQEAGVMIVTAILSHHLGHREETTMRLPADTSGSKNAVQSLGSSVSYGKRYTAGALLNLTARGEDDDGMSAGTKTNGNGHLSPAEQEEIKALLADAGADSSAISALCAVLGVQALDDLRPRHLPRAKKEIAEFKAWKASQ